MGFFDDAVPGGNITKPLMVALGALLVGKMMSGSSAPAPATGTQPGTQPEQGGGLLSTMGQKGGLLGGLGGLLEQLTNAGHGQTTASWVGPGQNAPIKPDQLGSALGQTTIADLARSAGMSEQELLAQLARTLPGVVDKLTPNGRVPNQAEILSLLSR